MKSISDGNQCDQNTRRSFLQKSIATAAAITVPYHLTTQSARAAAKNEKPRYALIGVGGNGSRTFPMASKYVDAVALCDLDATRLDEMNQQLAGGKLDTHADYREVLARTDIDVVQILMPDHWHAKILIEAMLAGKDAYCEKPLTLTIDEGKLVRKIQKQTGRIVQVGTQQRSSFDKFNKALAIIADGRIGKLKRIMVGIDSGGWSPEIPVAEVPEGFDWEAWLGWQRPRCSLGEPAALHRQRRVADRKRPFAHEDVERLPSRGNLLSLGT